MEDKSVFTDKAKKPSEKDVAEKLGSTYPLWKRLHAFVIERYPGGTEEWNYPGPKYGWSFRIKDKKRVLIYFLPREKYFKVALVFGDKATEAVLHGNVSAAIKDELKQAKKYAEGRGIRIDVKKASVLPDIEQLIEIKLKH